MTDHPPAFSPPPYVVTHGQICVAIGAALMLALLLVCGIASWRARRLRYSLLQLFGAFIAVSFIVGGAVQWERALSLARSEEWVAIVDGDLIRKSDLFLDRELIRMQESKSQFKKFGSWSASLETSYDRLSDSLLNDALRNLTQDLLLYKAAKQAGVTVNEEKLRLREETLRLELFDPKVSVSKIRERAEIEVLATRYAYELYTEGEDSRTPLYKFLDQRAQYVFIDGRPVRKPAEWFVREGAK